MNTEHRAVQATGNLGFSDRTSARYTGHLLLIVKVLWVTTLLALLSLFCLGSTVFYGQTRDAVCQPDNSALAKINLTADACTILIMLPDTVTAAMFLAIA